MVDIHVEENEERADTHSSDYKDHGAQEADTDDFVAEEGIHKDTDYYTGPSELTSSYNEHNYIHNFK